MGVDDSQSSSPAPLFFFHIDLKVNDVVPWVLDLILNKHIISPNPHVRQAACIWLLSLVKKLSTHKAIKVRNMPFQSTGSLPLFLLLTLFLSLPSCSLLLPLFCPCWCGAYWGLFETWSVLFLEEQIIWQMNKGVCHLCKHLTCIQVRVSSV